MAWFWDLLYGSRAAEFTSAFGLEDSVVRLKSVTSRNFLFPSEQVMAGRVSANRVVLRRVNPAMANSWAPVFTGRFEAREGRTILVGKFAVPLSVRVFMTFWFGGIALWTLFVTLSVLTADEQSPVRFFPFYGIAMFLGGVLLVWGGKWWARGDQAWLSDRIARGLGATPGPTIPAAIQ